MFKKLNSKVLIIILIVLAAIYYISTLSDDKERSFRNEIVAIDTAQVTDIIINIAKEDLQISLTKTGNNEWDVMANGNRYPADKSIVKSILGQYSLMKPKRIAATSSEKWDAFEVSDSTGTRVTLLDSDEELTDIYIGKFSYTQPPQGAQQNQYQQQRGTMTSFVRIAEDKDVYAVEGFLKMSYQSDVNAYRNKNLINVNKDDISKLEFKYPDRTITLAKEENKWMMNGQPADSANTVKYLNKIYRLNSSNFVDQSTQKLSDATFKLSVEGNNFSPIEVSAFPTADTTIKFVISSSINPGAEFDGSKAKLYEKVFVDETAFLPEIK
ncbi:MAG: DUF4340 domain-containing protein [Bacteroidales bacterium]|nr:DUF4340 domain-containing protein [Bacteroidales bacterium]